MATNIWFWIGFNAFVLAMLALDLGVFHRKAHVVRPKEAMAWVAVWVALAMVFAGGLWFFKDAHHALTFLTGYVIEESLSVDNIFVIVLIFSYFRVPEKYQHRVLFWGIVGALLMRGLFIGLGTLLLARFHWIIYIFGGMLIVTGIRMASRTRSSASRSASFPSHTSTTDRSSSPSRMASDWRRRCSSCSCSSSSPT